MTGTPTTGPTEREADPEPTEVERLIDEARAKFHDDDPRGAFLACKAALDTGDARLEDVANIALIFDALNQPQAAEAVRQTLLQTIDTNRADVWNDAPALAEMGGYLIQFDSVQAGERYLARAFELAPDVFGSAFSYFVALNKLARFDDALAVGLTILDQHPNAFAALKAIVTTFDHFDARPQADATLAHMESHAKTDHDRETLNTLRAGFANDESTVDQRRMATDLFDNFANNYDMQLAKLGNNGPSVILSVLAQLGLAEDNSRRILDAGCGTGLCAPFLRPLAETLLGVDLSIPMLERCRERGEHDLLARTDLAALDTFPEGMFDMVICADVLVYFGALEQVFGNFASRMEPGAWLVLSVEELDKPDEDHRFFPSGRHKHSEPYLRRVLGETGFDAPTIVERARLRNELGDPVFGIAMASQRGQK